MATDVSDYTGFDFGALWQRRDKVTEVETALLLRLLRHEAHRRFLELGTGGRRLTGTFAGQADELILSDVAKDQLARASGPWAPGQTVRRVALNLYHLPFRDRAFTGVGLVRVFHHLSQPLRALSEIHRVLAGGGSLVVSYNPRPSLGTLANDVRSALRRGPSAIYRAVTLAREDPVALPPGPFPVYIGTRSWFLRTARAAGFHPEEEAVSGLEEYPVLRRFPSRAFVRMAEVFGEAPGFPTRWRMLRVPAPPTGLAPLTEILACPACKVPLEWPRRDGAIDCSQCGYAGSFQHGVVDLRYFPPGSQQFTSAPPPSLRGHDSS